MPKSDPDKRFRPLSPINKSTRPPHHSQHVSPPTQYQGTWPRPQESQPQQQTPRLQQQPPPSPPHPNQHRFQLAPRDTLSIATWLTNLDTTPAVPALPAVRPPCAHLFKRTFHLARCVACHAANSEDLYRCSKCRVYGCDACRVDVDTAKEWWEAARLKGELERVMEAIEWGALACGRVEDGDGNGDGDGD